MILCSEANQTCPPQQHLSVEQEKKTKQIKKGEPGCSVEASPAFYLALELKRFLLHTQKSPVLYLTSISSKPLLLGSPWVCYGPRHSLQKSFPRFS